MSALRQNDYLLVIFLMAVLLLPSVIFAADNAKDNKMQINITVADKTFCADPADNHAVRAVMSVMPLTLTMSKWSPNNEYYTRLPNRISVDGIISPGKFVAGDIALYQGLSLVIFYAQTTDTAGYIPIGHIADYDGLIEALSLSDGSVTFSKNVSSVIADDQSVIRQLYKVMYQAMIAKDIPAMEAIHDESFVLVHMTGTAMNQREYLSAVKDGTLNYYSAHHDDIDVRVTGNKATLCGRSRVNAAVYGGGKHTWRLQQDMTLKKVGNEWKFIYSKASTY